MQIDLNADLGESFSAWRMGDDDAMLNIVTSANVACGFHAGDPVVMRRTVATAAERGVTIGAHVSYPDRAGFGRRFLDVAPAELTADVLYQLGALDGMCRIAGTHVRYVKPHGALYTAMSHHEEQVDAVLDAITAFNPELPIVGLPGSVLLRRAAERGLGTVAEAFADRAYRPDGTLVPRSQPDAVLHDPEAIAARMLHLVVDGEVEAAGGAGRVPVEANTLCVHSDTPNTIRIARRVLEVLTGAGVHVASFR
ncbi:LamB/YcsF family protein [Granulicoccus sp. GXG6511]|uniref:LamB/YcsF family protein n=1 Tax=Granulicoccus sp. GXG6511 TaxID=3381351 RepID=UPI003D7DD2A6